MCVCGTAAHLNRVHIVCNDDQSCFFLLNEVGHMIYAVLQCDWFLFGGRVPTLCLLLSQRAKSLFLLSSGLGTILVQKTEQLGSWGCGRKGVLGSQLWRYIILRLSISYRSVCPVFVWIGRWLVAPSASGTALSSVAGDAHTLASGQT